MSGNQRRFDHGDQMERISYANRRGATGCPTKQEKRQRHRDRAAEYELKRQSRAERLRVAESQWESHKRRPLRRRQSENSNNMMFYCCCCSDIFTSCT